jgi:hypothetical protein
MKQQTPVEWFEQQLDDLGIEIPFSVFNEAKEMESEKNKKYDEMLEMLKELVKQNTYRGYEESEDVIEAKKLIKEASKI